MKKFISMLLASALSMSLMVPVMAEDNFKDLDGNFSWAKPYVEDMADRGLISGFGDGTYRPGEDVARKDAFALFARLLGSNSDQNKDVLEKAKEMYGDKLSKYKLTYAEGDVAFLLYRNVLSEDELDTYFKGTKATEAMLRYEAAILITKVMLAEDDAAEEVVFDIDYTDAAAIPNTAKQYVYYVTEKGIMSGTGNGNFEPKMKVQRGQIAVMLAKTVDCSNYYFEKAVLETVNTKTNNMKITEYDDEFGYAKDTVFIRNGKVVSEADLAPGQSIVITYSETDGDVRIAFIDILASEVTEVKNVIYNGYSSSAGVLSIGGGDPITGKTKQYECSPNAIVTLDGALSNINKIKAETYVALGFADGVVVEITSLGKTETIKNAEILSMDPKGTITIKHEDEAYNNKEYGFAVDARIVKDSERVEFADLYRGDKLTIKLEYGVISNLTAEAVKKTVTGTLRSFTISESPTLTIKVNGEDQVYDIPAGIKIVIDGEDAKLADFEVGCTVKLSLASDAIVKIEATETTAAQDSRITGVVTSVDSSIGAVAIKRMEGDNEVVTHITCKSNTKYFLLPTFSEYSLKEIKVGDTVEAYGSYQSGFFVSTGMTVSPAKK